MPQKTYVSHTKQALAVSRPGSKPDLYFVGGRLVLESKDDQDFIESLPSFKDESITLLPPVDKLADAVAVLAVAKSAQDAADKAVKAAEAVVAGLTPKPEKKPEAPKDTK